MIEQVFLIFILSIMGSLGYYVFSHLWLLFGLDSSLLVLVSAILFASSSFVASAITARKFNNFTRIIYFLLTAILGIVFLVFFIIIIYDRLEYVWIPILGVAVIIYSFINAQLIKVKFLTIPGPDLRIVQISDTHIGPFRRNLHSIVSKVNELNPDVVVITGDLADGPGNYTPDLFEPLTDIRAPVYLVWGNHDRYAGLEKLRKILAKTKVKIIEDKIIKFKGINIIGVSDKAHKGYVKQTLSKMKWKGYSVLLCHKPVEHKYVRTRPINLMLSGHTHAGQIWPMNFLVMLGHKPYIGLHKLGDMYLYISPGTGLWGPQMRLGSRNEITCIDLGKLIKNKK